ncbi:hypothetical protein BDV95DRAFT_83046 [Massariosphaeria phaeospora]|uniref:F-box domain-containing protein n=1 Tax=Massariosphaeria phaeospora TaxID=100035 RepID=A0A7C8M761_9PLEO|nr:hypothetical protein BDV95DRAFT_83046 [Massariosphaeria phaeospora]
MKPSNMNRDESPPRPPTSTFSNLSEDLKLDVFDFVRSKSDQGNARLVSQEWNRLMRPAMWRDFTTSLRGSFANDLHKPSEQQLVCFHDIRALAVGGKHVGSDYEACFSSFMRLLRSDQLLHFTSAKETPLKMVQLLSILRQQKNLRSFRARLDLSNTASEDKASWTTEQTSLVTSALRALTSLRIYFKNGSSADNGHEMECSSSLVKAAPLLDCLEICGWRPTPNWREVWGPRIDPIPPTALFGNTAILNHIPRKLRHLLLADANLSGVETTLLSALDCATLCSLKLEYCDKIVPFLQALTTSIQQTGTQLKVLTIRTRNDEIAGDNDCTREVRDLLSSFGGLEELELDYMWCGYLDWKATLRTHRTLKKFEIGSGHLGDGHPLWTERIAAALNQCPNLQYFIYSPTRLTSGYILDCQIPGSLPMGLVESLDVVAATPTLRKLRLLTAPGLSEDRINRRDPAWVQKASDMAQGVATLVLTHLYLKGSNIQLLILSPSSRWKQAHNDRNQHYYPHYCYRLQTVDYKGKKLIIAAPLRDYIAEYPDAAIFV